MGVGDSRYDVISHFLKGFLAPDRTDYGAESIRYLVSLSTYIGMIVATT